MKRTVIIFALICLFLFCPAPGIQAANTSNLIPNVPDWNQPNDGYYDDAGTYHQYTDANGNPINGYVNWCAPTAGANVVGYWEDIRGKTGLADGQQYPNSPAYPNTNATYEQGLWHDGTIEMGWYMDTNAWSSNTPVPFSTPPGVQGTMNVNIGPGLLNYTKASWTDNDYPMPNSGGTGIVKTGFPDAYAGTVKTGDSSWSDLWYKYVCEINSGVPSIVSFSSWVDTTQGYQTTQVNGHNVQVYNNWEAPHEDFGHAVVGVGYIDPNPNSIDGDEYFICQDNWSSTGQYVAVPLGIDANNTHWAQSVYLWAAPIGYVFSGSSTNGFDWNGNVWINLAWNGTGYPLPNDYGVTVTFGNQSSCFPTLDLISSDETVGNITFSPTTSTTIQSSGGHTLKLDNGSNPSIITVAGTHAINANVALNSNANITVGSTDDQLTIGGSIRDGISGPKGISKYGAGLLLLSGSNLYSGPTLIAAGTLKVGNTLALGSPTVGTAVAGGGTLDLNGFDLGAEQVTIQDTGVLGNGAIISSTLPAYPYSIVHKLTLSGNATIGATWRWDVENPSPGNTTTGYLQGNGFTLIKVGWGETWLKQLGDTGLGDIFINNGRLGFQGIIGAGDPSKTITVAAGASLGVWDTGQYQVLNKNLVFQDGSTFFSGGGAGNSWNGDTILNGNTTFQTDVNLDLSGNITGTGGITKSGSGTLFIAGMPGYDGQTIINEGILQVISGSAVSLRAVSGAGTLGVDDSTSLTADSINVGTLTIGSGCSVTIAAIPGGPLAEPLPLTPVPEPSAWAMFILTAILLGIYRRRTR